MKHAQTYYCKSNTLGTKIKLAYDSKFIHFNNYFYSDKTVAGNWLIPSARTNALKAVARNYLGSADLMVVFDIGKVKF